MCSEPVGSCLGEKDVYNFELFMPKRGQLRSVHIPILLINSDLVYYLQPSTSRFSPGVFGALQMLE